MTEITIARNALANAEMALDAIADTEASIRIGRRAPIGYVEVFDVLYADIEMKRKRLEMLERAEYGLLRAS